MVSSWSSYHPTNYTFSSGCYKTPTLFACGYFPTKMSINLFHPEFSELERGQHVSVTSSALVRVARICIMQPTFVFILRQTGRCSPVTLHPAVVQLTS